MEFLVAVIPVILEPFVPSIVRRLGYAFRFRSKVNALTDEVNALQLEIDNVRSCIAERGEVPLTNVQDWQNRAGTAIAQAEAVIRNGEGEGCCSLRLKTRYRIGKQAADGTQGIVRLREERGRFGLNISRLPDLQQIVRPPVEGYEAESRTELLNKVMAALLDPDVAMVGVHGVGGIGKTTLAKEVHRYAAQNKLFDKVVLATVTVTPELRRIQDEIAEFVIGPKLQESTDSARASRLNQRLKDRSMDTSILIILDDLWDRLDLGTVGIPTGYNGHGCKILLTSRRLDLLSDMGSKQNFHVGLLSEKESASLFEREVVEVKDTKIAEEILIKCGGFPLLIVTVAGLVRNKGLHAWKDASTQLSKVDNQDLHDKVYSVLNLSYDRLSCEETKSVFLLCGMCSRTDTTLLDLLRYSLGLGLLRHYTMSDARNRLKTLIDDLKACSLLDVDEEGRVKMHDVVRDMCTVHKDQHAFRHTGGKVLKEWPSKSDISSCTRVSLPYSNIGHLPEDLGCPDVEFLLLFSIWSSINIPDSTFQGTRQLRVIHFTGMKFASLPGSLHSLTNLQTLSLERCHLLDVAAIGQLKTLEILSFRRSDLVALPSEIGHLTRLKSLDLSYCSQLDFIPADDVISKLTSLEELLMIDSFDNWESEESAARRNARLSELKCLSRLASLEICVSNVQALPKDFSLNNGLERYLILIGQEWRWETSETTIKTLKLNLERGFSTDSLLSKVRGLLEESEALFLNRINGSKNLLYDSNNQGFPKLKRLCIDNSVELQQIVDCKKHGAIVCFPLLETLQLWRLESMATICEGRPAPESFGKIKMLHIVSCNKLKNLFSLSMLQSLSQLEEILVKCCNEMEAVFVEDESDCGYDPLALGDEVVELPRLRLLKLWSLPQLKCFLYVRGLDKQMSIFNEKVALPNLEKLILGSIGKTEMIWCNQLASSSFGKLNSLSIYYCHELRTVFPHDIVERFQNLKSLEVRNCSLLEGIYHFGNGVAGGSNNIDPIIFGLNKLELSDLPRLKHIWREDLIEQYLSFQKLESMNISECESLKSLFPLIIAKNLSELKNLEIRDCGELEEIIAKEEFSSSFLCSLFCQLTSLTLTQLPELRSLYLGSNTWSWPNLENVTIQGCPKARIFGEQEASQVPNNVQTFFSPEKVFPNLERMSIDGRIWKSILECQSWLTHLTRLKSLELSSLNGTLITEASQFANIHTARDLVLRVSDSCIRRLCSYSNMSSSSSSTGFDAASQPSVGRRLELYQVKGLRHVWVPNSQMDHLESLKLEACGDLISLATSSPSAASFRNLSTLELINCSKLTELMKPSTATTMANLVTMRVRYCDGLKEIVAAEDDDNQKTRECIVVVFSKLKILELFRLYSLEGFCLGSCYSSIFPCLEEVSIRECPSMRIFCNGDVITPKLQNVNSYGLRQRWDGDLNTTIKQLHQVELQNIWSLKLSRFPELVERRGRELQFRHFSNLWWLVVDKCPLFRVAVPSNILPVVSTCRILVVEKCNSLEKILDLDGMDQTECHVGFMHLVSTLKLIELPKLRHIWNVDQDPLGISCFKNLTELYVHKCGKLTHIFSLPVALGLVRLQKLEVKECALVEVIIKQQGDERPQGDWNHRTIFPQLMDVELENLPSLMGFYSGGDVVRCTALDTVSMVGCPRICLLRSTASSTKHGEINVRHDGAADEPTLRIFNEQVEILRLRKIVVQWNSSMNKVWYDIVPPSFLCSLEFVQLIGFSTVHQILPLDFAEAMPNLFKFTIGDSFYEHRPILISYRKTPACSSTQLEYLELFNLPELKHLVVEFFQPISMLQHLRELRVSKCQGLTRLVTSSAARSLVNLELLVVKECERMTEIVSSGREDVRDEIMFRKLKSLELDDLPCLTSFSSGDYAFSFPRLGKVIARECPNMNTFSKNIPSTPLLDEVQIGEDETDEDTWRWEGELNSTIEKFFAEKNPT